jgi:UDP-2-acetamido-3-amino-2,3-dideoxy-glucuronate N-acetyltransferase
MIHPLSDVQCENIGVNTTIWQYTIILKNAVIGRNCNINCHVFIENDVVIGDNVTVKSGVYLWDGICIEDNVFIGPNVTFTNDKTPRSRQYPSEFQKTTIRRNASIGAGTIVLGGIEIGEYAMTGAGALVTQNIPPRALLVGSPARIMGWLNEDGTKMIPEKDYFLDKDRNKWKVENNSLMKL